MEDVLESLRGMRYFLVAFRGNMDGRQTIRAHVTHIAPYDLLQLVQIPDYLYMDIIEEKALNPCHIPA